MDSATYNNEINELKKNIRVMNTALEGKKFLLGDELSVADIVIANCLMYGFQTVLDQGFMKSIKNVNAWAANVFALPEYVHIFGKV